MLPSGEWPQSHAIAWSLCRYLYLCKVQLCLFRQMLRSFGYSLYALTSEWNISDLDNLVER